MNLSDISLHIYLTVEEYILKMVPRAGSQPKGSSVLKWGRGGGGGTRGFTYNSKKLPPEADTISHSLRPGES